MKRCKIIVLLIGIHFLITCGSSTSRQNPNVVFIILDDFRPAISALGDPKAVSPNIDKIVQQSYIFQRAYSQQALCAPSRNSLLTSRRPDSLRLYDFNSYWRSFAGNFTTLPQYFKSHGYHTFSIGKIFHPGISSNFTDDYPLSWSEPTFHPITEQYMNAAVCGDVKSDELVKNVVCPVELDTQPELTLPDIESMLKAKEKLRELRSKSGPFFLSVGFHKPHIPLKFPSKYLQYHSIDKFISPEFMKRPSGLPSVGWSPYLDIRTRNDVKQCNVSFPYGPMDKELGVKIRQAYYASVTYIDDLIGELVTDIDNINTIIVITSDHGWSLGEHADWSKYSNYDVALNVPLIIKPPSSLPQPQFIDHPVELLDIFPTIVDFVGLPPLARCGQQYQETCTEGKSLIQFQNNSLLNSEFYAFSQYPRPSSVPSMSPNFDKPKLRQIRIMGYTVRTKQYRYTIWVRFYPKTLKKDWSKVFGEELYDHFIDSNEDINLNTRSELILIKTFLQDVLIAQFQ